MSAVFGHNSELPGGRGPFWIKDEAFVDLGLHIGDVVAVDLQGVPEDGDLVVVELELDGDSVRTIRRWRASGDSVTLQAANAAMQDLTLSRDQVLVVGVVTSRIHYEAADDDRTRVIETPIE